MDVKIVSAPYLRNASSDFDGTLEDQGHREVTVTVRGQRSRQGDISFSEKHPSSHFCWPRRLVYHNLTRVKRLKVIHDKII